MEWLCVRVAILLLLLLSHCSKNAYRTGKKTKIAVQINVIHIKDMRPIPRRDGLICSEQNITCHVMYHAHISAVKSA